MKRTGEILKKAREEKDLSLHEIGLSLKINNKILKAIEDGDTSKLPAKTFLRGFVQSYANFLHLNTDEVLAIFYEEMGSTKPTPYKKEEINSVTSEAKEDTNSESTSAEIKEDKIISSEPLTVKEEILISKPSYTQPTSAQADIVKSSQAISSLDKKSNFKTYIGLIAIAGLLAVIVFVKQMIDKYSKEAEVPSNEVAQTIENATPILFESSDNTMTEIETSPSPLSPASEANSGSTTAATPTAPAVVTATVDKPTEKPSATTPSTTDTKAATPAPPAEAVKKEEPKKVEVQTNGKPVELIVEALDGVEIEYSAPNGPAQKIKLSSEQVHTFKSKSGLIINFSNGGVVNLILNGKDIGIPGDLGKPIKLSY